MHIVQYLYSEAGYSLFAVHWKKKKKEIVTS